MEVLILIALIVLYLLVGSFLSGMLIRVYTGPLEGDEEMVIAVLGTLFWPAWIVVLVMLVCIIPFIWLARWWAR